MIFYLVPHWFLRCTECTSWLCLKTSLPHLTDHACTCRKCVCVFEAIVLWRGHIGVGPCYRQPLSWVIVALLFRVRSQSLAVVAPVGGFIKLVMWSCSLIHLLHKRVHHGQEVWSDLSAADWGKKAEAFITASSSTFALDSDVIFCFFYLYLSTCAYILNIQRLVFLFYRLTIKMSKHVQVISIRFTNIAPTEQML